MKYYLSLKLNFISKAFFAFVFLFLSSCGEVISSREFSTVITTQVGWKNVQNINTTNIMLFPLTGTCTTEAGAVTVMVGNPMLATTILPCVNSRFSGSLDLTAAGLAQGMNELLATQSVLTADALTNLLVEFCQCF
jgi:hypothetical protein